MSVIEPEAGGAHNHNPIVVVSLLRCQDQSPQNDEGNGFTQSKHEMNYTGVNKMWLGYGYYVCKIVTCVESEYGSEGPTFGLELLA